MARPCARHGVAHSASKMGQGRASPCRGQSQSCRRLGLGCEIQSPSWERRSLLEGSTSASLGRACAAEDTRSLPAKMGLPTEACAPPGEPSGASGRCGTGERHRKVSGATPAPVNRSPEDWECLSGRTRGDGELHPWRQTGSWRARDSSFRNLMMMNPLMIYVKDNCGVVQPNQHMSPQQPWKESTERQEHTHQLQNTDMFPALLRRPHPLCRTALPGCSPTLGGSIRMDDLPPTDALLRHPFLSPPPSQLCARLAMKTLLELDCWVYSWGLGTWLISLSLNLR
ncbi:hypothetical protein CRENBAI_026011 [Crenichthys baileyi]|uniref:Uncharacterized protein n=1 Tax=Crenichthys baileyi TaxID=28760 RepID=A0AAV9RZZ3_9TELE